MEENKVKAVENTNAAENQSAQNPDSTGTEAGKKTGYRIKFQKPFVIEPVKADTAGKAAVWKARLKKGAAIFAAAAGVGLALYGKKKMKEDEEKYYPEKYPVDYSATISDQSSAGCCQDSAASTEEPAMEATKME